MSDDQVLPALRPLEVATFRNERNELYFALRDMTQVAPQAVTVSLPGYFVLAHLDGRHTARDIQLAFLKQFGQLITLEQVERLVNDLDKALLLDTDTFEQAYAARRAEYLAADARDNRARWPDGAELRRELSELLAAGEAVAVRELRGVIAPHLDYRRGGPCYADAYATLARAPAERYVILGTNHFGRARGVVATGKDFQTPLGRVPVDREFIVRLEHRLGCSLREQEFDHYTEHSVELQVHMLQVCRADAPFTIVPILCPDPSAGRTGATPSGPGPAEFADALAELLAGDDRSTVLIAGADLSHVGQHFGERRPTTPAFLEEVARRDRHLLELLEQRREDEFVSTLRDDGNPTRICSVGCIYALLRALPGQQVRVLRYHQAVEPTAETHVTCAAAVVGTW